jgi:hypothetical protein
MAGQSISAHADAATVATLRRISIREGWTQSQITASALRLYLALPDEMRVALWEVEAFGTSEHHHNMMRAIARVAASARYEIARRRAAEGMRLDDKVRLETDDDILTEAVRVTAKAR